MENMDNMSPWRKKSKVEQALLIKMPENKEN